VKGLKIYEDVFTTSEIMKVADFINEIRQAGRNGGLSGKLCFLCCEVIALALH
jgi:mRNA N6-methyladenine demethylase